jgi:hypothetical protein
VEDEDTPRWDVAEGQLGAAIGTALFVGGQPAPLVAMAIAPHLFCYATLNGQLVHASVATAWSKSFADVVARAVTNLAERPPKLEPDGRLARMVASDDHAASRLLVPGFVDAAQAEIAGRVAFAIPTPGTCLLCSGRDPEALAELYDRALELWHQSDQPLSPVLYTRSDDGETFEPLRLDDDHACRLRARRAEVLLLAAVYAEQRASLDGFEEAPDLAPLEVLPHETLGVVTLAIAIEEAPALLPDSELVALRRAEGETPQLVTAAALRDQRLLVRVPDFEPPRYGLVRFPSAAEIEAEERGSEP